MKKIISLVLAVMLLLSVTVTAFAYGTGTISVTNTTTGKSYAGYKIFDATYDATDNNIVSYTIDSASPWFVTVRDSGLFDLNQINGTTTYNVVRKADTTDEDILNLIKAKFTYSESTGTWICTVSGVTPDLAEQVGNNGTISWNAPYGYYLITSNLGAVVSVDTSHPDVSIIDKNQDNSWHDEGKYIMEGDEKVKVNDASIGDTLSFLIGVDATNYSGDQQVIEYTIDDTLPTGITYNKDAKVYIDGAELAADKYSYTESGNGFSVVIPWATKNDDNSYSTIYNPNTLIEVKYTGTMNEQTLIGEANVNTAKYNFRTDDPTDDSDEPKPGFVDGEEPTSITETFSSELSLTKVDGADTSKTLTGAKFSIAGEGVKVVLVNKTVFKTDVNGTYYRLTDGTYTTEEPVTEEEGYTAHLYESTTVKYSKVTEVVKETYTEPVAAEGYVNANGVLTFTGLREGEYTITELVAPAGYNLLTTPITVVVTFNDAAKVFTATVDGAENAVENGVISFNVANNAGDLLPATGGIGTTIFYVIGGLLVLAAVVLLVTKKRMSTEA